MRNAVVTKPRAIWVKAGIWLIVFVLLMAAGSNLLSAAAKILPQAREYKISSFAEKGFTVEEALKNEEALAQAGITAYASQKAKLTGENGTELSVVQKITDDRYADVYKLSVLRGTYFVSTGMESMDHVAVISDKAALALFKSLDADGEELYLNQTRYTVVGVYETDRSLLSALSSDGADTVFIPMSSQASAMEQTPVNLTVPLSEEGDAAEEGTGVVQELLGAKQTGYQTEDLTQAMQVMEQNERILWFVIGITGAILFLCVALGFFLGIVRDIRRRKRERDPSPFWTKKRACRLLAAIGMAVFAGVLCTLVSFTPDIPSQYLPKDNLFDLGHYWEQFLNLVHTRNACETGYDFTGNAAFIGILLQGAWLILSLFAFFAWFGSTRKAVVRFLGKDAQKK